VWEISSGEKGAVMQLAAFFTAARIDSIPPHHGKAWNVTKSSHGEIDPMIHRKFVEIATFIR
jgi:hypothetical protein